MTKWSELFPAVGVLIHEFSVMFRIDPLMVERDCLNSCTVEWAIQHEWNPISRHEPVPVLPHVNHLAVLGKGEGDHYHFDKKHSSESMVGG